MFFSAATFAQQKKPVHIVFIGNSITQGVMLDKAPPAYTIDYLKSKDLPYEITWSNQGVSGFTTVNFLPETNTVFPKVEAAAKEAPKGSLLIFSVKLGTNDSAEEGPLGSPVSPEDYFKNMKTVSDKLLADFPGCKIMYQRPLWYSPNTYNGARYLAAGLARLQSYFPQIERLVKMYAKSHPGQVITGDKDAFAYFKKNHLTDLKPEEGKQGTFYLHPNDKGAKALGEFWGKAIEGKILNRKF
ncbi:MAG: lipolytic protein G-D-S-L family [Mucilaginibacter polytrichastri]|nr:lipolytic protein G-D-S-L family [Mucilaginibacter polytrichastri]